MMRRPISFPTTLRSRLAGAVGVLVLGATLLAGPLAVDVAEHDLRAVLGGQQYALLSGAAAFLDDQLEARLRQMAALAAALPVDARHDPRRLQAWLAERTADASEDFVNIAAFARNGELVASGATMPSSQPLTAAGRPYFEETLLRGRGIVSDPFQSRLSGAKVVVVTAPVFDDHGEILYVLAGRIDLQHARFLRQVDALRPGGGYLFLMSADGVLIDSPPKAHALARLEETPGTQPGLARALHGFEGWLYGDDREGPAIVTYRRLATTGWILGARNPEAAALAPLARVRRTVLVVAAVLALVAGILAWWLVRWGLRPLDALQRNVAAVRHEGVDIDVLALARHDEVGELGRAFHDLVHARERASARMRAIADNVPAVIAYVDRDERFEFTNAGFDRMIGTPPDWALGRTVREALGEAGYTRLEPLIRAALRGEHGHVEDVRSDDATRHQMIDTIPDVDQEGRVVGFTVMAMDISERKEAELAQAASEQRLRLIADNLPVLICYIDRNHRMGFGNATFDAWLGLEPVRLPGMHLAEVLGKPAYDAARPRLKQAFEGVGATFEMPLQAQGRHRILEWTFVPDVQAQGRVAVAVAGVYALAHDMTRVKEAESRLVQMARFDSLTGIANRRLFGELLGLALERVRRQRQVLGVAYMDIDHFKAINDTWGHGIGDEVLKEFAQRLAACVRVTDTPARLAGDEFVVLLEDVKGPEEAERIGAKIVDTIRRPFATGAGELAVTASVGIALVRGADGPLPTQDQVLGWADGALYAAKHGGRDRWVVRAAGDVPVAAAPAAAPQADARMR
ncbi:diguanylate cyclase domain-containing protein [Massilia luteola]|uniref:diguanylate cyclase domain-containing protein n=1 Tax=Massilia luteola TaxID=3081751 RepID=UPI002ACC18F4|nr:diguanylate cyclase [Massilia sp. Gc5]